mmetsp:Transcript_1893/g.5526  ORF Transcript_1893/g.5526 Transcript_1893/m.5526 type:complete len:281 (+) Transcript_1893:120-962(+)
MRPMDDTAKHGGYQQRRPSRDGRRSSRSQSTLFAAANTPPLPPAAPEVDEEDVETLQELSDRVSKSAYEAGRTKIGLAAQQGNVRQVERIIYEGGSANEPDEYGETPLHLAAASGQMDMIRFLSEECRCDVNSPNWEGWTPLFWAVARGQLDAVKYLVQMGSEVGIKASQDWTALHLAALNGDLEMVSALLEAGADPNAVNSYGCSSLSFAVNTDVAAVLEDHIHSQVSHASHRSMYSDGTRGHTKRTSKQPADGSPYRPGSRPSSIRGRSNAPSRTTAA